MTYDDDEIKEADRQPGPEVTPKLFRQWQKARRGSKPAEEMTNPVWQWLFRGRVDPYHANERFKSRLGRMLGRVDFSSEPRWAGCRMGQSRTDLADGRVFWIAGEHEDYYDPDFFIYNDLIVENPEGRIQIVGYPETSFRPTDFHSATAIEGGATILIIGSIGYSDARDVGRTQVYALNTETFAIAEVESKGNAPGWINKHDAALSDDGNAIIVRGGEVMTDDGFLENIDEWALTLADRTWTRLTTRKWLRFQVSRADGEGLHLWQYSMRKFALDHPGAGFDPEETLGEEIGGEPDMDAFNNLYTPLVEHTPIERDPENEDDWRANRIMIDGVCVRYNDDTEHLSVTVEGDLPKTIVESFAADLKSKLALIENTGCQIKWIE